jgi:hypothetical protein
MMMKRRRFLKNVIATSVVTLGGTAAFQVYQQNLLAFPNTDALVTEFLSESDQMILLVFIPVFIAGLDLDNKVPLSNIVTNIDSAILRLPMATQKELRDMFDLLGSGFGRVMVANVWLNWQSASSNSIGKFLIEWRDSYLGILQIAYKGLHKLIVGSVYAEAAVWASIGYPGPPKISFVEELS